jgi:hypothetical protein
MFLDSSKALSF